MKIYTLTLSPAFDIHAECEQLVIKKENLLDIRSRDSGGKGINISRALKSLGIDSTPIILLGKESKKEFLSGIPTLSKSAVIIECDGRIRENLTVHTKSGETRLSFKGTEAPPDLFSRLSELTFLDTGDILTFTGRLPEGASKAEAIEFLKRQKSRGIRVIIDSSSLTLSDICEISPYLIKPNEEEISKYLGKEINAKDLALEAAKEIRARGTENVMISLGALGAALSSSEGEYFVPAPKITPISTIGAGDSSIAGFILAKSLGLSARDCLIYAVSAGSAACQAYGTEPPRKEDTEDFIKLLKC